MKHAFIISRFCSNGSNRYGLESTEYQSNWCDIFRFIKERSISHKTKRREVCNLYSRVIMPSYLLLARDGTDFVGVPEKQDNVFCGCILDFTL